MNTVYFRKSFAILGLFVALMLLAACGGDSAAPEATAEPATEAAPTTCPHCRQRQPNRKPRRKGAPPLIRRGSCSFSLTRPPSTRT